MMLRQLLVQTVQKPLPKSLRPVLFYLKKTEKYVKFSSVLCIFFLLFFFPAKIFGDQVLFVYDDSVKLHRITLSGFQSKREPAVLIKKENILSSLAGCDTQKKRIVVVLGKELLDTVLNYCQTTPVVFAHVSAPLFGNYREYKNLTGIGFELSLRHYLADLRRLVPEGSRVGFVYSSDLNGFLTDEIKYLEAEFALIGEQSRIESTEELGETLKNLIENKNIKVLWILPDPIYNKAIFRRLAQICQDKKIILVTSFESLVKEAGAAYALAPSYFDVGLQLADVVAKIEKGAKPEDIPFGQPQKIGTYVNISVFENLGIKLPDDIKNRERVTDLVDTGQDLLNAGKEKDALSQFRQALRIDRRNSVANYYVNLIEAKENYVTAIQYLKSGNNIRALPYLVSAADILPEARAKLTALRTDLKPQQGYFLREGITAFKKKQYTQCIQNMRIVLLIEPDHREALLYKEKAEKRAQAVAEFRE